MKPDVECVICHQPVSHRKSLAFEGGRACRHHQELIDALAKMKKDIEDQEKWKKAERNLKVIMAVSMVRSLHTIKGIPLIICYDFIRTKCTREEFAEVEKEINKLGAKMSNEEVVTSLLTYSQMMKNSQKEDPVDAEYHKQSIIEDKGGLK